MSDIQILTGDCREMLKTLPAESVQCVVTSPPYFNLRDYGTAIWNGGDAACSHERTVRPGSDRPLGKIHGGMLSIDAADKAATAFRDFCGLCNAVRVDSQIGLESSPAEYVAAMVAVFDEVRRVLRKDGTVWLNLGDSYAVNRGNTPEKPGYDNKSARGGADLPRGGKNKAPEGLKPKDLIGIPWRVAFALQEAGWYLRSDIVWEKPNPMPESVTDRPTKAHEYVFLLAKSARYFYDAEAISEPAETGANGSSFITGKTGINGFGRNSTDVREDRATRNKRSVWTVNPQPFPGSHFATMPEALVEPCILAGTSEMGACSECGSPWRRVLEREPMVIRRSTRGDEMGEQGRTAASGTMVSPATAKTTGWEPTCNHASAPVIPCTVLDPFLGSGTVLRVVARHRRSGIGIELNPEYVEMAYKRLNHVPVRLPLDSVEEIPA